MLTKTDLNQIGNVVDEKLEPIKKDLAYLKNDVTDLKKDVRYLRKKVNRIDKTVSLTVKNYDEGDVKVFRRISFVRNPVWKLPSGERRVRKTEEHIGLTS